MVPRSQLATARVCEEVKSGCTSNAAIAEAIAREESQPPQRETDSTEQDPDRLRDERVTLRQRAWPFVETMKRTHAENADIDWGI
jgi:Domain of unknown function (DUF1840)